MADSIQRVARIIARSLEPAAHALDHPDAVVLGFLKEIGWTLPSVPQALKNLGKSLSDISHLRAELDLNLSFKASGGSVNIDLDAHYLKLALAVIDLLDQLRKLPQALPAQLPAAFIAATDFPNRLFGRLVDHCLYELMLVHTKRMEPILRLIGLIEVIDEPAIPAKFQPAFRRRTIRWDRFGQFLGDPKALLIDVLGLNDPAFDGTVLLDHLMHLSFMLAGPAERNWPSPARIQALTGTLPGYDKVGLPYLKVPLIDSDIVHASVAVLPLKAAGGQKPGIAFGLLASAGLPPSIKLSELMTLTIDAPDALAAGVSVAMRVGQPPKARLGLEGPIGGNLTAKRIGATINIGRSDPMRLLDLPGGTSLDVMTVSVGGGVGLQAAGAEPYFDVGLQGGKLTLALGGTDGFLEKILPGGPISADFDIGLAFTPSGVALTGSGALTVAVPLHIQLGPMNLETLTIVGQLSGNRLDLETSLTGGADIGPIKATVERVGLISSLTVKQGNLGPLDLSFGFKPPTSVGLSVDAGIVVGGGFLSIDVERGQYSGALQLIFADFLALNAVGLIQTKMPDGSKGFSLLIIITAEFGSGIQLGFGFTLLGVGGLLGLNRGMLFQPIMDGVRTNAISSVMFPQDVIANAPRIISDLQAFFPAQDGTFLIGPMARLGWGQPTLVSLSLGVIVEVPPGDIAILGVLKLAMPAADIPILQLQVNFAGALEFDKQRIYFYASLYDSHILFITLDGSMGLLFAYGDDADFVLSVGGFHPKFNPPALPFPTPQRISLDIINTSFARIHCDGYFAVTTNTVQFGTHSSYYFGFDALSVQGSAGFDALIQFSPFHFTVSFSTSFSVKVFGVGVYGVGISLTVEGPTPWHAAGTASISLLFFDVDIDIAFTWGDRRDTMLPPIAVMPLLSAEFGKHSNWRALPPTNSNLLVSLRPLDAADAGFVLHPVGALQVSQRLVPLDLTIDKFGNQKPTDGKRFSLNVLSPDLTKIRDLQEPFAPAQFRTIDDAGRLSQQSYVPQDSGVELAIKGTVYASSTAITRIVRYDLSIIDTQARRVFLKWVKLGSTLFSHLLRGGAVARNPLSAFTAAQTHPFDGAVAVSPESFSVALKTNNTLFKAGAVFTSQAAAHDFAARAVADDPGLAGTLHVVPQFEMAA